MPKNRQHYRKIKYPDKVTKQKRLVFVRIFLFSSVGSRNAYFPTAPFCLLFTTRKENILWHQAIKNTRSKQRQSRNMVIVSLMKDTGWSPSKVEESLKEL